MIIIITEIDCKNKGLCIFDLYDSLAECDPLSILYCMI